MSSTDEAVNQEMPERCSWEQMRDLKNAYKAAWEDLEHAVDEALDAMDLAMPVAHAVLSEAARSIRARLEGDR